MKTGRSKKVTKALRDTRVMFASRKGGSVTVVFRRGAGADADRKRSAGRRLAAKLHRNSKGRFIKR